MYMCVCVCMYIHIYVSYICTCVCVYVCIYIYMYHIYVHVCVCMYIHIYVSYICIYMERYSACKQHMQDVQHQHVQHQHVPSSPVCPVSVRALDIDDVPMSRSSARTLTGTQGCRAHVDVAHVLLAHTHTHTIL